MQPEEKRQTSKKLSETQSKLEKSAQSEADALMRKLDEDIARVLDQEARAEGMYDHNADKRDTVKHSSLVTADTESNTDLNDSFLSAESTASNSIINYMSMDSPRSELTNTSVDRQISFPLIGSSIESPTTDLDAGSSRAQHSISEEAVSSSHRLERESSSPRKQVVDILSRVGSQVSQSESNILSDSSYHSADSRSATDSDTSATRHADRRHSDDIHADSRHTDDILADSRHNEDIHADNRHNDDRHTDSRHNDDRHADSRHNDERHADSRHNEDRQADSRYNNERHPDSRNNDDRHPDSRHNEDRHPDSRHNEDRHTDSRHNDIQTVGRHNNDRYTNSRNNNDDNLLVTEGDMSQLLQDEIDDENEDYARLLARALNSDIFDDAREHTRMEDPLENLIADVSAIRSASNRANDAAGVTTTASVAQNDSVNTDETVANEFTRQLSDTPNCLVNSSAPVTKAYSDHDESEFMNSEGNSDIHPPNTADEDILKDKLQGCKPKDRKIPESDMNELQNELTGLKFASVQLSALKVVYSILSCPKYGEMLLVPNTDLTADHSKALPDGTVVRKDDDFKKILQEFMKKMVVIAINLSPFKRMVSFEELDRVHWMLLKTVYNVTAESQTCLPKLRGMCNITFS